MAASAESLRATLMVTGENMETCVKDTPWRDGFETD
jgi:hypothetical protein